MRLLAWRQSKSPASILQTMQSASYTDVLCCLPDVMNVCSHFILFCSLQESGIDDDVLVMTEDFDDLMDEDAVVIPGASKSEVSHTLCAFDNPFCE